MLGRMFFIARIILKRLWSHPGQTLLSLLGMVLAVGLTTSAPLFSRAVDLVMLREELAELSAVTDRPPLSVRVRYFPSRRKPLSVEDCERVSAHIADTLSSEVHLPLKQMVMQVESSGMLLQPPPGDTRYGEEQTYLGTVDITYLPGSASRLEIIAGEPLQGGSSGEALEVWVHTRLASEMGLHIGERYDLVAILERARIPIRVAGIWQSRDASDPFWFKDPDMALRDTFLVRREEYITHVQPYLPSKTGFVSWYIVLDDSKILPQRTGIYTTGFERAIAVINKYLPGAELGSSPMEPLKTYQHRGTVLMTLLLEFSVPVMGFLLYFLALISIIIVRWQRRETATMVSRGMGKRFILAITLVEGLIVIAVGGPLGLGVGLLMAQLMGHTISFLSFVPRPPLPLSLAGIEVRLVVAALSISLIARLWPALRATRQSVVTYERAHARPIQKPFWQRYYLDILLAIPTAYSYRQMTQWGTLARLVQGSAGELYRDPLLILVPTLFVFTASLLSIRLFPLVMRLADWLSTVSPWVSPHLIFRQLARQSGQYVNPLLLVIAALSLGTYMASMAGSLDQWLVDRMFYRVGADLTFEPCANPEEEAEAEPWLLPVSEYLAIPGIEKATRVGDYPVDITLGDNTLRHWRFLGIDRLDFPNVAQFRSDFTAEPLGELMNRLALHPDGILVPRRLLSEGHLWLGDKVQLRVMIEEVELSAPFTIVGAYDYFPTAYQERPAVVGNLEYLFYQVGGIFPYHVWLGVDMGADNEALFQAIERKALHITHCRDAWALIKAEQEKMERVGVFGTLSTSFLAAAVMAGVGLLVYNYASLRDRIFRFAILRSLGLMRHQLLSQVVLEHFALTIYGAGVGVLIGVMASRVFIPFFRFTGEESMPLPPLMPLIAWDGVIRLVVGFVGAMVLAQVVVVMTVVHRGIFQVLRMGD